MLIVPYYISVLKGLYKNNTPKKGGISYFGRQR